MLLVLRNVIQRLWHALLSGKKQLNEVKSTHRAEVVPVILEKHPNADALSIVRVGGYQLCVRTEDWLDVDKGVYIQPDSIVPDRPEYAFLGTPIRNSDGIVVGHEPLRPKDRRITAKKFRKERSEGLLMPAPAGSLLGENVASILGIERYVSPADLKDQQPPVNMWDRINRRGRRGLSFSGNERGPSIWVPVYDLENWYRFMDLFEDDYVVITEKIHGANFRAVYSSLDERLFVGSRTTWKSPTQHIFEPGLLNFIQYRLGWKKPTEITLSNWWLDAAKKYPGIELFCRANPDCILFGEVYGAGIQDLTYGLQEQSLVAFDIFERGAYWSWSEVHAACLQYGIPSVPILYKGIYSENAVRAYIDGYTLLGSNPKQIREGCVIRTDGLPLTMRKILKAVSSAYLERSNKDGLL